MRETITTIGELCGAALVCLACFTLSSALGLFVTGTLIAVFSWLAAR